METSGIWQLIIVPGEKNLSAKIPALLRCKFHESESLYSPQSSKNLAQRFAFTLNASSVLIRVHLRSIKSFVFYFTPLSNFFNLFQN